MQDAFTLAGIAGR